MSLKNIADPIVRVQIVFIRELCTEYKMHKYITFRKSYWQKYLTRVFTETEDMSYYVGEGLFNRFSKKVCLRYIFLSEHKSRILKFRESPNYLFTFYNIVVFNN